jgi:hypothetical protein
MSYPVAFEDAVHRKLITFPFCAVTTTVPGVVTGKEIDNVRVPVPPGLVAVTVNVFVAGVVGVPVIEPAVLSVRPSGREPELTLKSAAGELFAVIVALYAAPTVASGNPVVVITGTAGMTVMVNVSVSDPPALLAFTVNWLVAYVVGVPLITPLVASVKPVGTAPAVTENVAAGELFAVIVALYAVPTRPPGNPVVVITGVAGTTEMVNVSVSEPAELDAFTMNVEVAYVVGVPPIAPSLVRVRPLGSAPELTVNVTATVLIASTADEYAAPT